MTLRRRRSETLFTATVASTAMGWKRPGGWREYVLEQNELCLSAQTALRMAMEELRLQLPMQPEAVSTVDDFIVIISHARHVAYFLGGFHSGDYSLDLDLRALQHHFRMEKLPIVKANLAAVLAPDWQPASHPSDVPGLRVIKRRHWNKIVRREDLRILRVWSPDQARRVLDLIGPELHGEHGMPHLYLLGYDHWDQLQEITQRPET